MIRPSPTAAAPALAPAGSRTRARPALGTSGGPRVAPMRSRRVPLGALDHGQRDVFVPEHTPGRPTGVAPGDPVRPALNG